MLRNALLLKGKESGIGFYISSEESGNGSIRVGTIVNCYIDKNNQNDTIKVERSTA